MQHFRFVQVKKPLAILSETSDYTNMIQNLFFSTVMLHTVNSRSFEVGGTNKKLRINKKEFECSGTVLQWTDEPQTLRKTGKERQKMTSARDDRHLHRMAVNDHTAYSSSNLNSNRYAHEVLQLEVDPFLQGIPGAIFQQENARPHVAKFVRDFCPAQHMKLLPWSAYSPDMLPIEHV
ncbi:hypothetical protein TNCV_9921 [Trichonephila clavipes]|nr:hypothetical protein TNCV_9921 [Trichonephila clavipes]